jgi:hypothetical protein
LESCSKSKEGEQLKLSWLEIKGYRKIPRWNLQTPQIAPTLARLSSLVGSAADRHHPLPLMTYLLVDGLGLRVGLRTDSFPFLSLTNLSSLTNKKVKTSAGKNIGSSRRLHRALPSRGVLRRQVGP